MLIAQARLEEEEMVVLWPNTRLNIDIVKLLIFNGEAGKVLGFLMACRLFIRIKMRNYLVKKQV